MKRLRTAVCCACVLGAAGLSAAQADKQTDKMDKGMKSMTVTGCVAEKDGHYMLNNAMMAGDTKPVTYDLTGGDLKAHLGHKVEVTGSNDGKMMDKGKMDKMDKMSNDKMTDKDKMGMSDTHGTLQVKSVKMISATCS
ncbi:MAG TPA: hypothetical protein VGG73_13880 [Vicinamibacterales bacterium]|jgi:hypothetical protein